MRKFVYWSEVDKKYIYDDKIIDLQNKNSLKDFRDFDYQWKFIRNS